ncbi:MAG: ribosome maturation factor RimM [Bryobacteraceae bacterium]
MLAHLGRTRGRTGEILAFGHARDDAGWYRDRTVTLLPSGRQMRIAEAWLHNGRLVIKFDGVDSISDAEAFRGQDVAIPKSQRDAAGEGEYYYADLVGCEMVSDVSGESYGEVTGWFEAAPGSPVLLEVGPMLVPFVPAICVKVELDRRRIRVRLPDGLRELNER